jgi:Zn-dependent peptidase ImmA (M78 family)/transcriptional regulator with XRE-family HTH domain
MEKTVNPAMITLARGSLGLTQTDLADKIGVPQGRLSKIESGQILCPPEILVSLVRALKFPEKFFYQTFEVYPAGMHLYMYRKHKTLPAKNLSRIAAWMNLYRFHVKRLLDAAEIEYNEVPHLDIDEFDNVRQIARAVRQYASIPPGPIENMTSVVEDMGIVVVPFNPGTRLFAGASMLTEKPNYVAVVNSQMPGDRWRWTLAHELGHMVMHRLPTMNMENEADEFAAEFLMPSQEIGQYLSDLTLERLASLKRYWRVSIFAILQHAVRLGKITERHQRTLITRLANNGITRLKEPAELSIPLEKPTLLLELVDFHANELGYSAEQMGDLLSFDVHRFLNQYEFTGRKLRAVPKVG